MAYCTAEAIGLLIPGVDVSVLGDSTAQAAAMADAASAATDEVNARCRRTFVPPVVPETRRFDGSGGLLLRVPDMVRMDAVSVDGSSVNGAVAYPLDGPPFLWIATGTRIPVGTANVSVTGLWGYAAAVPDGIARAAACLAATNILRRLQADRSGGVHLQVTGLAREEYPESGPYGDTIAQLSAAAARLLLPFRRWHV